MKCHNLHLYIFICAVQFHGLHQTISMVFEYFCSATCILMTNFFRMLAYVGACKIHIFLPCYLSLSLVELDIYPLFLIFFLWVIAVNWNYCTPSFCPPHSRRGQGNCYHAADCLSCKSWLTVKMLYRFKRNYLSCN